MEKMTRGVFKKWAQENRERLVLRFQLEQMPGRVLVGMAEERGHETSPRDNRNILVRAVMGELWVDIPQGYNRRNVCRVLGIPLALKSMRLPGGSVRYCVPAPN